MLMLKNRPILVVNIIKFFGENLDYLVANFQNPIKMLKNYRNVKITLKILIGLGPSQTFKLTCSDFPETV